MGNSINRSANQTSDEHQPNNSQQRTNNSNHNNQTNCGHPNQRRLRFSTSLLSLSNFTSKHLSRSRRSYSVTNVDQTTNASKSLNQVIREISINFIGWLVQQAKYIMYIWDTNKINIIQSSHLSSFGQVIVKDPKMDDFFF